MPRSFGNFRIKATLPDELQKLDEIANNFFWTWNPEAVELFRRIDRDLWNSTYHNPVKMLGLVSQEKLMQLSQDEGFMAQLDRIYIELNEHLMSKTWFENKYAQFDTPKIAYFSMEFGLNECLPNYSGGLGILAGDHLKSASELGIPLVGVGLLYQRGYFQQYLNSDGWQQETYPDNDFYNLPIRPEVDELGKPILIAVKFPGRNVYCRVWKAEVGRIPLYLLDTNTPENDTRDRRITYQLYGGDEETRIQQEIILGIGGMEALRKLDAHTHVCHMNEGHAAFMAFERIRHRMVTDKLTTEEAIDVVRGGTIFTTHTPVPAGIDIFHPSLIQKYLGHYLDSCGISLDRFLALGRRNPNDQYEPFNMAIFALRTTAFANGVSRLHGEVSRRMWQVIYPRIPEEEIPIDHITNGIHTRSWISSEMSELLTRYLGPNWIKKPTDHSIWERVEKIPDIELWRIHERRRARLVAFARKKLAEQLKRRGVSPREISHARETLNPDALTIGFARRFATYKRATLILRDTIRLKRMMNNPDRPIQFIFAGKAHPRDNEGKELIKRLIHFARQEDVRHSFVFLENYDINVARYLVQGVDLWLNNPQRPQEASGTSGMKVLPNGGLNLSVLDGWWDEGYRFDRGWSIGSGENYDDPSYRDEIESTSIYDALENEVAPLFYDRGSDKVPRGWIRMVKNSMKNLCPVFSTNRMVQEYTEKFYTRAYTTWKKLSADNFGCAKGVVKWKNYIRENWSDVRIIGAEVEQAEANVGDDLKVIARINLGNLNPDDLMVQAYYGPQDVDFNISDSTTQVLSYLKTLNDGTSLYEGALPCMESGMFGYSIRIMPYHRDMVDQFGLEMMRWIDDPIDQFKELKEGRLVEV